jgi:hypothetical protein
VDGSSSRSSGRSGQMEVELVRERTKAGLAAGKARDRVGGRPKVLDATKLMVAKTLMADGPLTVDEIAGYIGVAPSRERRRARQLGSPAVQIVRDRVGRFNAQGSVGLMDRKPPGTAPRLTAAHQKALAKSIGLGPLPIHGVHAQTSRGSLPVGPRRIPGAGRQTEDKLEPARVG